MTKKKKKRKEKTNIETSQQSREIKKASGKVKRMTKFLVWFLVKYLGARNQNLMNLLCHLIKNY